MCTRLTRACQPGAAPGETGYASLRGKQLDFLNAEDFRCHAIRGRAIQTFSRTHSAVATSSAFTRAQSDITDIRRHHDEMRSLSPERADDPCASLETVLEPVFEADEPIARPYLAWACSQLGVWTALCCPCPFDALCVATRLTAEP